MTRFIPALLVLLVAAFQPQVARAEINQQNATTAWRSADQCAKDAFKKFPDYTSQSNAHREAFRLECLRDHRLPAPVSAGSPQ